MFQNIEIDVKTNDQKFNYKLIWSKYSFIISFVIIFFVAAMINKDFLNQRNIINILMQTSIVGIISLGMTLVILTGGIDLSVGSMAAFIGGCTLMLLNSTQNIIIAIIGGLILGIVIGGINGVAITKGKIAPFIVTLSTMAIFRSLILYIGKGGSISGTVTNYKYISSGNLFGLSYPIYIFIILTTIISFISLKLKFGRHIYAVGSNEKAAKLSAINVDWVKIKVYMLSGFLTAMAAIIESSRLNSISSASTGNGYELDAIAAVIIGGARMSGGRGKILGTFFGILILGILNNMLNLMNISPYLQGMVKGIIIIISVLIQKREN